MTSQQHLEDFFSPPSLWRVRGMGSMSVSAINFVMAGVVLPEPPDAHSTAGSLVFETVNSQYFM
jgi:hypothetical protein